MRAGGVLFAIVALLLVGGAARLAYIETSQGDELRRRAARQQTSQGAIPSLRGEILDTRCRVLAGTTRHPSVYVDPSVVEDVEFAAYSLAPVLGLDALELDHSLRNPRQPRFLWLKRGLSENELAAFNDLVRARGLRGFGVQTESIRVYPQGRLAPHVLGFVGTDLKKIPGTDAVFEDLRGLGGIEAEYDRALTGRPGRWSATVDVGRRQVRAEKYDPATDGATLVLTIDAFIQQVVQDTLRETVNKYGAEWGACVVIDPQTGEVLAMASIPDFDPADPFPAGYDEMSKEEREEAEVVWRNRAVSDAYEPGSAFKPFIASSALDEGVTRIDEVFAINGPVHDFGRRTIRDTHPYGSLALHEVISKSSNIGMGILGGRCGMERLHRYVRTFGFGDVTGLGLPGEHTGLVQDFAKWNPSFSPQSIPIGQEIGVTPIQLATGFSVFCNGGVLYRPRIIRGIVSSNGETLEDHSKPIAVRRVLDEQTATTFRLRALVETVTDGTAKAARLDDYQVFGKTGTAQIAAPKGHGYAGQGYVATFIGGAPSDHPRVVCLVSVYRPTRNGYYGGQVSAPAVKEILAETLAYMQVPAELHEPPHGAKDSKRPARPEPRERKQQDDDASGPGD